MSLFHCIDCQTPLTEDDCPACQQEDAKTTAKYTEILSFHGCDCCPNEVQGWNLDCPACGQMWLVFDCTVGASDFFEDNAGHLVGGKQELLKQSKSLEVTCANCKAVFRAPITTYDPDELEFERISP
jgi:hypothetical protein